MQNANRVILNTLILYAKMLLSTLVSLVSIPIVLGNLGKMTMVYFA